jgi:hypothetical protein
MTNKRQTTLYIMSVIPSGMLLLPQFRNVQLTLSPLVGKRLDYTDFNVQLQLSVMVYEGWGAKAPHPKRLQF